MQELAQYIRIQEETETIINDLKQKIKDYMELNNLETLTGNEHKATYKAVVSSRLDTSSLKKEMPEIALKYTKTAETKRFTFN